MHHFPRSTWRDMVRRRGPSVVSTPAGRDIPLLKQGEKDAVQLGQRLEGLAFAKVLVSPLGRARRTCELAGFGDKAEVDPELHEWDYGDYEGRRTADIRQESPGWYLFRDGCSGGESIAAIGARADRVIARLRAWAHALARKC
jgi:broad specificity phosphatase PhoE